MCVMIVTCCRKNCRRKSHYNVHPLGVLRHNDPEYVQSTTAKTVTVDKRFKMAQFVGALLLFCLFHRLIDRPQQAWFVDIEGSRMIYIPAKLVHSRLLFSQSRNDIDCIDT